MTLPPLAVNLRSLRKAQGWTQVELAEASGVCQPTISAIERGDRSGPERAVEMLAAALGADASALRSPWSCGNCAGKPPRGFICQTCGSAGEPARPLARGAAAMLVTASAASAADAFRAHDHDHDNGSGS